MINWIKFFSHKSVDLYNDIMNIQETIIIINKQRWCLLFIKNFIISNFEYIAWMLKKEMCNDDQIIF